MKVFIIMFHNTIHYPNDVRIMKVCLTETIANKKLKEYEENDKRTYVEYYILDYDLEVGDLKIIQNEESILIK